MYSAYNFNLYLNGNIPGSIECPLYTCLTVVSTCLFLTETADIFTNIISIIGRFRRGTNFYKRVAADTGGTVYNIKKDEIATVLDKVIEVSDNSRRNVLWLRLVVKSAFTVKTVKTKKENSNL